MNRISDLNLLLGDLGRRYNIANLHFGGYNAVGLTLKDKIELTLEYVPPTDKLFVYTVVATLPDDEAECAVMCRRMVEMNCVEQETFGGILALDDSRGAVLYQIGLAAAGLTSGRLEQALQDLLAHRQHMIDRVTGVCPKSPVKPRSTLAHFSRLEGAV